MKNHNIKLSATHDAEWERIQRMTEAELRQELLDEGIDPDAEIESMRRLGRVMAAKYARQIEQEAADAAMAVAARVALPRYEEAAAAGAPQWVGAASPPNTATLLDLLGTASPSECIWARVSGWSMRDVGIHDGDHVLVNVKREARDGDLVLAHLEGQGQLVKRLRIRGGAVVLESANPDFGDIEVEDPATLRIQGVVTGRVGFA